MPYASEFRLCLDFWLSLRYAGVIVFTWSDSFVHHLKQSLQGKLNAIECQLTAYFLIVLSLVWISPVHRENFTSSSFLFGVTSQACSSACILSVSSFNWVIFKRIAYVSCIISRCSRAWHYSSLQTFRERSAFSILFSVFFAEPCCVTFLHLRDVFAFFIGESFLNLCVICLDVRCAPTWSHVATANLAEDFLVVRLDLPDDMLGGTQTVILNGFQWRPSCIASQTRCSAYLRHVRVRRSRST